MNEAYATSAFDSLEDGIATVDADGTVIAANEAWRSFLEDTGIDPAITRVGANYLRTLRDTATPIDELDSASSLALTVTLPYRASDDSYSHRLRIAPFVYDGERFASLSVGDDDEPSTTPLKTRAMDEAPAGITIGDYTRPDNPLVYANAAFTRITGYDVVETLGRNCRFLQCPDTEEAAVDRFRDAIDAGESTTVELRNARATARCSGTPSASRRCATLPARSRTTSASSRTSPPGRTPRLRSAQSATSTRSSTRSSATTSATT